MGEQVGDRRAPRSRADDRCADLHGLTLDSARVQPLRGRPVAGQGVPARQVAPGAGPRPGRPGRAGPRDGRPRWCAAAGRLPVAVVCDDDEVAAWAARAGATVLWRPGRGLNARGHRRRRAARGRRLHPGDRRPRRPAPRPRPRLGRRRRRRHPRARPPRRRHQRGLASRPARASASPTAPARSPATWPRPSGSGWPLRVEREQRLGWDVDLPADLVTPDWLAS